MRNALWLDSLTITEEPRRSYDGKMRWGCVPANVPSALPLRSVVPPASASPIGGLTKPRTPRQKASHFVRWRARQSRKM